jgi:hypothetical protein
VPPGTGGPSAGCNRCNGCHWGPTQEGAAGAAGARGGRRAGLPVRPDSTTRGWGKKGRLSVTATTSATTSTTWSRASSSRTTRPHRERHLPGVPGPEYDSPPGRLTRGRVPPPGVAHTDQRHPALPQAADAGFGTSTRDRVPTRTACAPRASRFPSPSRSPRRACSMSPSSHARATRWTRRRPATTR